MKEAMEASSPAHLLPGQWHLPYVDKQEFYSEEFNDSEHLPVAYIS